MNQPANQTNTQKYENVNINADYTRSDIISVVFEIGIHMAE